MVAEQLHGFAARACPFLAIIGIACAQLFTIGRRVVAHVVPAEFEQRRLVAPLPGFDVRRSAADHVLQHEHAQPIAMVIPARRFHFDVFAHQVEPACAHGLDIEHERFVGRCGHKAVRPIRLVEHALHENRLSVQEHALVPAFIAAHLHAAKRAVAFHLVVAIAETQLIQVGVVGRPWVNAGDMHGNCACGRFGFARSRGYKRAIRIAHFYADWQKGKALRIAAMIRLARLFRHQPQANGNDARFGVGLHFRQRNVGGGNGFHPHALPNAALSRVPYVAAIEALFAAQAPAEFARVGHAHHEFVFAWRQQVRDIEREGQVASHVRAGKLSVHAHGAGIVDGLEVQQQPFAAVERGRFEGASVPKKFIGLQLPIDSRQGRFGRERHDDGLVEQLRQRRRGRLDDFPQIAIG